MRSFSNIIPKFASNLHLMIDSIIYRMLLKDNASLHFLFVFPNKAEFIKRRFYTQDAIFLL